MNDKVLHITINGKPAHGLMFKYRLENEAKKIGYKFVNDIVPSIDEFFETQAGTR
jgi:hypothetical protein